MHIATKFGLGALALLVSSAAFAETTLDTSSPAAYRASRNQMAIECDGSPRGQCFLELLAALKTIDTDYFDRMVKGTPGGTAQYTERWNEMAALRKKDMNGLTRSEILQWAAKLKAAESR
jgi:hypothetical protein